ncbi:MAG TPA: pantoate--beta-alanine ligase [Dehalococcoidia bacterium]|jgi:pantoate--beta-alanine ligase|nr:pantoate--beta-alanine ligase [Dehalococcoidia bacterium]
MQVVRTVAELRELRSQVTSPVGLVPTMGALHDGHVSLVQQAREQCATVIASLFVNPTQFGPDEDFERYPRDEQRDLALFEQAGTDIVFMPSVEEMYLEGDVTVVTLTGVSERLEGGHRPGHFDGVATVVTKLFNQVQPDRAYFGQKDAQQLLMIRTFTRDLHLPIEIVGCRTVREPDGLALSSRNVYLSDQERTQALALSRGLKRACAAYAAGLRDAGQIRALVHDQVDAQPLADIDYISLAHPGTLVELAGDIDESAEGTALLSLAVRVGTTRLIDNVVLGES